MFIRLATCLLSLSLVLVMPTKEASVHGTKKNGIVREPFRSGRSAVFIEKAYCVLRLGSGRSHVFYAVETHSSFRS